MSNLAAIADNVLVLEHLERYSRQPFREMLARSLGAEPTPKAIKAFATKYPDRYAQYVSIFARLGGFSDKIEVDTNINITVKTLADSELLAAIDRIEAKLRAPVQQIDDAVINQCIAESNSDNPK